MEELDEALEEGRMARDTLIHSNMGLVHSYKRNIIMFQEQITNVDL